MNNKTRALIVGAGSIGQRHAKNLTTLGVTELAFVEPNPETASAVRKTHPTFSTLEEALTQDWNLALVCTPSHLHLSAGLLIAKAGIPLFIEKPVATALTGTSELLMVIAAQKLITLVGCNMRFHPGPETVKALLSSGAIGNPYLSRIHCGSYLPDWRPGDYRKSYSAHADQGGGCLLDCIHEIDLAQWYLGPVKEVFCWAEQLSHLEVKAEDIALLVCKHDSGKLSQIELDYFNHQYDRGCHVIGSTGTLSWDYTQHEVVAYDGKTKAATVHKLPPFATNEMYLKEMRHFLECIETGKPTCNPVSESLDTLATVLAAKQSSQKRMVMPKEMIP